MVKTLKGYIMKNFLRTMLFSCLVCACSSTTPVSEYQTYNAAQKESIDKVIDKAGGLNGDLNKSFFKASIKQQNESYSINLNQYFNNNFYSNAFTWTGGDFIFISQQDESQMGGAIPIVTVLGGVKTPGKVLYKEQASLFYYLSKSRGIISNVSMEGQ